MKRASPGFEQRAFSQNHELGESLPFQLFFPCVNLSLLFVWANLIIGLYLSKPTQIP